MSRRIAVHIRALQKGILSFMADASSVSLPNPAQIFLTFVAPATEN